MYDSLPSNARSFSSNFTPPVIALSKGLLCQGIGWVLLYVENSVEGSENLWSDELTSAVVKESRYSSKTRVASFRNTDSLITVSEDEGS